MTVFLSSRLECHQLRDPPYMTPLVKHLCRMRNKTSHMLSSVEANALQERINGLIRKNMINVVNCEHKRHAKGSKPWWDTVNKIASRNSQSALPICTLIYAKEMNAYFQRINTEDKYLTPEPLGIPEGTEVPALDSVRKYLTQLKQTSPILVQPGFRNVGS